jgi:hypothetical protein
MALAVPLLRWATRTTAIHVPYGSMMLRGKYSALETRTSFCLLNCCPSLVARACKLPGFFAAPTLENSYQSVAVPCLLLSTACRTRAESRIPRKPESF